MCTEKEEARRFLGLDGDSDIEEYLRAGLTLLGKRVALVLPDDVLLAEALLVTARKLVKLGATTTLVVGSTQQHRPRVDRTMYPRCDTTVVDGTSADELAAALVGCFAMIACAGLPADDLTALLNAQKQVALPQLVLMSETAVYGHTGPLTNEKAEPAPATLEDRAMLHDEEAVAEAARATGARLVTLRLCPLWGGGRRLDLESCLADVLALSDLVDEYLNDLRRRTGVLHELSASRRAQCLAAMLPPGSHEVQLTHADDAAGAAVFSVLRATEGVFNVCSAPATLQELFDRLGSHMQLHAPLLEPEPPPPETTSFATDKIAAEGYTLLWPELAFPAPNESCSVPPAS